MNAAPAAPSDAVSKSRRRRLIPLGAAAGLLIATALIGQVLGFMRTKLINANFSTDDAGVYFAAFNIPDFFFYTIAAGALGVAFMPYLTERLHNGDRRGMWQLANSLLNLLAVIMLIVGIIIFIFAKPLISHIVAPDLTPEQLNDAAAIMRFLALNPFLFTVAGILTTAQQVLGRFFFYAIAPLFYNVCIIASIYLFRHTPMGIVGLGIGAAIGAVLQLLIVFGGLIGTKYRWHGRILWRNNDFRGMLKALPPRSLDQGMDQVQSIVETNFASNRDLGGATAISNYNNAFVLHTAPILLIGTAISTAAFPRLNQRLSQGRPDLFRKDFLKILRAMIWITMPAIIIAYYARGYLARLIFTKNSPEIALIFGFLVGAIFFRVMYAIMSRWFYAQKDTKTPLFVSIFTISFNVFLAWKLSRPNSYGVVGLALAQTIVAGVEVAILAVIMLFRDRGLFNGVFWGGVLRIISVTGFSLVAGFIMISFFPLGINDTGFVTLGGKLMLISGVIIAVHVAMSSVFGLEEVRPFLYRAKKFILKPIKIQQYWQ